jgi:protein MpaA
LFVDKRFFFIFNRERPIKILTLKTLNNYMNKQRRHHLYQKSAIIIFTVFSFSGCVQPPETPKLGTGTKVSVPVPQHFAGVSVENRPIMYNVLGNGSDVTFIIATIHGDEPAGTPLVNYLADYLNSNPELLTGRKVVILPIANPDGLAAETRFNVNKVDLNRNFHADNRINDPNFGLSALSEPEAHIIYTLIHKYKPARIVSIHQPYALIDYDGPAEALAKQMALYCDLPVEKLGARPGSLGAYAGEELGIPIITFEMRENDSNLTTELLWQKYGKSLLAAITFPDSPL